MAEEDVGENVFICVVPALIALGFCAFNMVYGLPLRYWC